MNKVTTLLIAALRLGSSLGNLWLVFVASKIYGIEHVGVSSLMIAVGLGISTLAKFGYDILAVKYLPSYISKNEWASVRSFVRYFSARTFLGLILLLPLYFMSMETLVDPVSVVVLVFSLSGMSVLSSIIKSSLRPVLSSFFELGYAFLIAGIVLGILGLAQVPLGLIQIQRVIAAVLIFYFVFLAIWTVYLCRDLLIFSVIGIKRNNFSQMNLDSTNFMLITLVGYFYSYGYVWLVGEIFDLATVAFIAVVARVVFAVNFSMMIANTIYSPKFAIACDGNNREKLEQLAAASLKMMMCFSLPPFLLILIFSVDILAFFNITGNDAAACLVIMAIAQMVNVVTGNAASILNLSGGEKIVRNNAVIHIIVATGVALAVSGQFGVVGLVSAFAAGIASQNIILTYLLMSKRKINIYKGLLRG